MTARSILKVAQKYATDNAPTLISALAVTGTLTTAYLTGKATFKAAEVIRDRQEQIDLFEDAVKPEFGKKEKALLVWKEYIPPAAAVVVTVACIVTANSMSASRLAGMAAAYKLTEKQYDEYKDKVKEKLGIQDEKRMRDELHEEQVRKNPPPASTDWSSFADDEVLFREAYTGRYFRSKMHIVEAARNEINATLIKDRYATLSDFYELVGLERTQLSGEMGWSLENHMDLDFTTTLHGDRPIIVMEYSNLPVVIRDYQPMYRRGKGSEDWDASYPGVH